MPAIKRYLRLVFAFFVFVGFFCFIYGLKRPNVVIILADDLGFDDVSFRGSNEFLTPNIDALAYSGLILKNFYTPAMCTPSRAALLTGKYPIHTGMQHYVIPNSQPWSLPLNETTIAAIFKNHGYFTSLFGKWHLGMSRQKYTPTFRGFDYHFGYLGAYIDYYDQTLYSGSFGSGHDFRKNLSISHEHIGTYVTDLLTNAAIDRIEQHDYDKQPLFMILSHLAPHAGNEDTVLQAPKKEIEKFSYIQNMDRRIYAAMISVLDKSVGEVIDALHRKALLNETILLFLSDNGGPTVGLHATGASNYPLRGQKNSPWEGGIRSSAALWSAKLLHPGSVLEQKMYIADLLPTLATAVGIELERTTQLDGLDMWETIVRANEKSINEREIVHNIDNIYNYISYMNGRFKYINGTVVSTINDSSSDQWLGRRPAADSNENDPRAKRYEYIIKNTSVWQQLQALNKKNTAEVNITHLRITAEIKCPLPIVQHVCEPLKSPCLFDIDADPCEMNNLYDEPIYAQTLKTIQERIAEHQRTVHTPNNKPEDPLCDPKLYSNEWTWWEDIQDQRNFGNSLKYKSLKSCFLLFLFQLGAWNFREWILA